MIVGRRRPNACRGTTEQCGEIRSELVVVFECGRQLDWYITSKSESVGLPLVGLASNDKTAF
jgi:hypothetical protein